VVGGRLVGGGSGGSGSDCDSAGREAK
jgi:hypothetical protein